LILELEIKFKIKKKDYIQMSIEDPNILKRINKVEERLDRIEERLSFIENRLGRVPSHPPPHPGPIHPPGSPRPPDHPPEPFRIK